MGAAPSYGYTSQFPMAQYAPGQQVCLSWPSKNHVAATCTNPYIPDTANSIYRSGPNPSTSPSQSEFKNHVVVAELNGKHQNGVIDFKGFQNCPRFCDNMDKSTCTGCFTVPSDLQAGAVYTFQWYWIFNEGSAPYTTCWEAKITGAAQSTTGQPATTGQPMPVTTGQQTTTGQQPVTTGQQSVTTGQQSVTTGQQMPVTTGVQTTGSTPQDIVSILNAPTIIPIVGNFDIEIAYSSIGSRAIIVEVLDNQGTPYGTGAANVGATKGAVTITVNLFSVLNKKQGYIVRAVIVDQAWASNPKGYELDTDQITVMADDSVVYATSGTTNSTAESSAPALRSSGYTLFGFAAFCVASLFV